MKIAIIGNGHIGSGLARAWTRKGHAVVFGARDPSDTDLREVCKAVGANAATVQEAVGGSDVVALAMPYGALDDVLKAAGPLDGKIVIDCTNALEAGMTLKYGHTTSAAEELQKRIPRARVFKSFNAQAAEILLNPVFDGVPASNFFCGDEPEAKRIVKQLVEDVGFEAVDAGPLKNARLVEPAMLLWAACSRAFGTRELAFKILHRE